MSAPTELKIQKAVAHAHDNCERYLKGFSDLLRIPSVSTDPAYAEEVGRAAGWLVAEMERIGLANCQAMPSDGHPVVYGEWLEAGDDCPTVMVYAHYDVQPVGPLELWASPPFEPTVREGKLFARGAIDDKCGAYINLKAFESMFETSGSLPLNIKVFFEGEEEAASPTTGAFIAQNRDLLGADLLLVSDGGSWPDQPLCATSARGIVAGEVLVTGPKRDLHSGSYGGFVHNPTHLVAEIIAAFHDAEGRIQIPGYYDDVRPVEPVIAEQLRTLESVAIPKYRAASGVRAFWGVPKFSILERGTVQPTLDVNGIYGGYQGEGGMTIIPARAGFKVSMRTVADQDSDDIAAKFRDFVMSFTRPTLDISVQVQDRSWPAGLLHQGPEVEALQRAYLATWGKEALLFRHGGSIPVLGIFQRELDIPLLDFGLGVGDNGHAPNEYMDLDYFLRGVDTAIHLYHYLADPGV
jgi:acetylornithine deacetylase/succinyl-diaminopimelate desuccinylase-like protein